MYPRGWKTLSACITSFALVISQANAGVVTGSVDCDGATKYCLIKGLTIKGEINDAITAALSQPDRRRTGKLWAIG
jgi:hypothetical protein